MHRLLRCYRATPLGTTKLAPAELIFPGHKFGIRLPIGVISRQLDLEELFQYDLENVQMKEYADRKKNVKTLDIQAKVGDACSAGERRTLGSKTSKLHWVKCNWFKTSSEGKPGLSQSHCV